MTMINLGLALSLPLATGARAQENLEVETLPAVKSSLQGAQHEMRFQLDNANQQLGEVHDRLGTIFHRGGENPGQPLVIRTSNTDAKTQAKLEEDLAVMSRILDKAAQNGDEDRPRHAMGINVLFGPGPQPFHSLYLEGYGALFLINAGFPLLPPPSKPEPQKEEPPSNSTWEQTRRELNGQPYRERRVVALPAEEYSEERVSKLKDAVLEALKNAPNIRDLKSEEWITVAVFGGTPAGGVRYQAFAKRSPKAPSDSEDEVLAAEGHQPVAARRALMTIRVKKADTEAFAKGKFDLDEFRKKSQITTTTCAEDAGTRNGGFSFGFGGGGNGFGGGGGIERH